MIFVNNYLIFHAAKLSQFYVIDFPIFPHYWYIFPKTKSYSFSYNYF